MISRNNINIHKHYSRYLQSPNKCTKYVKSLTHRNIGIMHQTCRIKIRIRLKSEIINLGFVAPIMCVATYMCMYSRVLKRCQGTVYLQSLFFSRKLVMYISVRSFHRLSIRINLHTIGSLINTTQAIIDG